ncbi:MAG: hypothetical protein AAF657_08945 [Acidobacteriota bacterium]
MTTNPCASATDQLKSLFVFGVFDNLQLSPNYSLIAQAISASGFDTVVLSTFHVHPDGTLYNGQQCLMANGQFNPCGDQFPQLPQIFAEIKQSGGAVNQLFYSIGNPAVSDQDLTAIQCIMDKYPDPANPKNPLFVNIQGLKELLHIDGIDCDFEPSSYSTWLSALVYFTELCHNAGLKVTYNAYRNPNFWLQALQESFRHVGRQPVEYLNLQEYGGGNPASWISDIENYGQSLGISDASAFVIPGYSCGATCTACSGDLCNELTADRRTNPGIRGAFVWQLGDALRCSNLEATLKSWADGVQNALDGRPCSA